MAILFPEFQNVSIGKITDFPNTDSARLATIVMYSSEKEDKDDELKLKQWISQKLADKNTKVIRR